MWSIVNTLKKQNKTLERWVEELEDKYDETLKDWNDLLEKNQRRKMLNDSNGAKSHFQSTLSLEVEKQNK